MFLALPLALLLAHAAPADPPLPAGPPASGALLQTGLVVRLEAPTETLVAPVVVHLVADTGTEEAVTLNDAGTSPDVTAGDGVWAGIARMAGDGAKVTLKIGDRLVEGGEMPFMASPERNLPLAFDGTVVSAAAGGQPGTGSPSPASPSGAPSAAPSGPAAPVAAQPGGGAARSDATLYIVFGLGALALVAIGYFWFRGPAARALPKGVRVVPELGLFGEGTPSPGAGSSRWVVSEEDERALLHLIVATLARSHAVVLQVDGDVAAVSGGPVYRASCAKPDALMDVIDELQRAHPSLAVVLAGASADWELAEEVGVFAIARAGEGILCARVKDGWTMRAATGEILVRGTG